MFELLCSCLSLNPHIVNIIYDPDISDSDSTSKATHDRLTEREREREREREGARERERERERERLNRWSENTQKTMSSGGEKRKDL